MTIFLGHGLFWNSNFKITGPTAVTVLGLVSRRLGRWEAVSHGPFDQLFLPAQSNAEKSATGNRRVALKYNLLETSIAKPKG